MNTNPNSKPEKSNKVEVVYMNTGDPLELTPGTFAVTPTVTSSDNTQPQSRNATTRPSKRWDSKGSSSNISSAN